MRRIIQIVCLTLIALYGVQAQQIDKARGSVYGEQTGTPIPAVSATWTGDGITSQVQTDASGVYTISYGGTRRLVVIFSRSGYRTEVLELEWPREANRLECVSLTPTLTVADIADLSMTDFVMSDDGVTAGDISPLLTASRDPYTNKAGFQFSPMRFRVHGYDSYYQSQYLNGMQMNNMNNGYSSYSLWNGLNGVARVQNSEDGLQPIDYSFDNIGETMNILTRASGYRPDTTLTFSGNNRTYNYRTMATHATGMMPEGWAITASASRRWDNQSYVQGQFYNAWGCFLSLEKQFTPQHSLGSVILTAPTERGVASGTAQEVYDLVESSFFNPNVGFQGGKLHNVRVHSNHEPIIQLQHYWQINGKNKLMAGVGYRFGKSAYSALNWGSGPSPRPDHYRNLPSYYGYMNETQDSDMAAHYEELWHSDCNVRYINWGRLYNINRNNYQVFFDEKGHQITEGNRSIYVVEDRRSDQRQFGFAIIWDTLINKHLRFDFGANYRLSRTANFNVIADLLDGDYWLDIDKYSEQDFVQDPSKSQVNLNHPNRVVGVEDRYGHNYLAHIQEAELWGNLWGQSRHVDGYLAFTTGWTGMYRGGLQRRGLFPDNSFGDSKHLNFLNYGVKGGITYKITGRHYLVVNASWTQHASYFADIFVSPCTRNQYVTGPRPERVLSGDLSYVLRSPFVKGRITGFYTHFYDETKNMSFYDDSYRAFSNYVLTSIESTHMGVEAGMELRIMPTLTAVAVVSYGRYRYANNPDYVRTVDNSQKLLEQDHVYWKGFHVSDTPQTAANLSVSYQFPFYMWAGLDLNYFGRSFISLNPIRRTDKARASLDYDHVRQEVFPGGFTLDASVGYSWRIRSGVYLRLSLSISNLLNTKDLRSGGYEQFHVRCIKEGKMMRPFDSHYFYMYGMTFFFNAALQFQPP